jgi:hypothetical protein
VLAGGMAVWDIVVERLPTETESGSLTPSTAIPVSPENTFSSDALMQALAREMQGSHTANGFLQLNLSCCSETLVH